MNRAECTATVSHCYLFPWKVFLKFLILKISKLFAKNIVFDKRIGTMWNKSHFNVLRSSGDFYKNFDVPWDVLKYLRKYQITIFMKNLSNTYDIDKLEYNEAFYVYIIL